MKGGANNSEKVQIKRLAEQGYSADDISNKMQIALSCVESFIKPVKKKSATKEKSEPEKELVFTDD